MSRKRRALCALLALLSVLGLLLLAGGLYAPRVVRSRFAAEARHRNLEADFQGVSLRPGLVTFHGVSVKPISAEGFVVFLERVEIDLSSLYPTRIRATGGLLTLHGTPEQVRSSVASMSHDADGSTSGGRRPRIPWTVSELAVRWAEQQLTIENLSANRTKENIELRVGTLSVERVEGAVRVSDLTTRIHQRELPSEVSVKSLHVKIPESIAAISEARISQRPLERIEALSTLAHRLVEKIPSFAPPRFQLQMDHFEVDAGTRPRIDLRDVQFTVQASQERTEVSLSFGPNGATPLGTLTLDVPRGDKGLRLSIQGELPHMGDFGIVGRAGPIARVEELQLAGVGHIALRHGELEADGDVKMRGLHVFHKRLSPTELGPFGFRLAGRGRITRDFVTLERSTFELGALKIEGGLRVDRLPSVSSTPHYVVKLDVTAAPANCQKTFAELPANLFSQLGGAEFRGDVGGHLHLSLDTRKPAQVGLDYDVNYQCVMSKIPEGISKNHFAKPFLHRVYLADGVITEEPFGPSTPHWTPLRSMSRYAPIAMVMSEDGGTFRKSGFYAPQIRLAVETNLRERRFARGASTLTQQLAKNLFLSRDKTLARKLEEAILTRYLLDNFTQNEILELYLNVVEFAPNQYGIARGAKHFFGKSPASLTFMESLFLAAMLPAPSKFAKVKGAVPDAWIESMKRRAEMAKELGYLSDDEVTIAKAEQLAFR